MDRVTFNLHPFRYPPTPHIRRHGPIGYKDYRDYRPWLEDDFAFRCVYCLKRQRWCPTDIWAVDHLIPQRDAPELECVYENLILTCQCCNNWKLADHVPDPVAIAYGNCLRVDDDTARVRALNEDGEVLERMLKLNHHKVVSMRREWLRMLSVMARCSPGDWKSLMGFPDDLPVLKRKQPPGGNSKPEGIAASYHERRNDLPEVYE